MGFRGRDVEIVQIDEKLSLAMACDSAGGIGNKELDIVLVEPYIVGRLTARVALLEVISVGAIPKMMSATISNEACPTGSEMLKGIKDELISFNIVNLPLSISTEKNFETRQTGVGITVVGVCETDKLRICKSKSNDLVYCLGIPKVGNEIMADTDADIVKGENILELLNLEGVHDIIPIGSQGILMEVENMAENLGYSFIVNKEVKLKLDINKSAGPSTCLVFTCSEDFNLKELPKLPLFTVGRLI